MAKKKQCTGCGIERNITLTANITIASSGISAQSKRLCIPCLLGLLRLNTEGPGTYDYEKAMEPWKVE